jgi:hypothetical protein
MAINHAVQASAVQRFLLTSERYLLSHTKLTQVPKQPRRRVPSLRTCVPREFTSEWVDPVEYRIDHQVSSGLAPIRQGCVQ